MPLHESCECVLPGIYWCVGSVGEEILTCCVTLYPAAFTLIKEIEE